MFCKFIVVGGPENAVGKNHSAGTELKDISVLCDAIERLNGRKFCQLFIGESFPDDDSMVPWGGLGLEISGGEEDRYYCQICKETVEGLDVFVILDSPIEGAKDLVEVRRGQSSSVWKGSIINKEEVLKLAVLFAETGEMSEAHTWKKSR